MGSPPPPSPLALPLLSARRASLLSCGALCPLSKCRHIPLPSVYDLTAPVCLTPSPKTNLIIALQNMDSADSQWILTLCVYMHLCMCAAHARLQLNRGSALGHISVDPVFPCVCPHYVRTCPVSCMSCQSICEHGVKHTGVNSSVSFLRQYDEWKSHYTNLVDRPTLVTSQTCLLDWLGNFQQEHT